MASTSITSNALRATQASVPAALRRLPAHERAVPHARIRLSPQRWAFQSRNRGFSAGLRQVVSASACIAVEWGNGALAESTALREREREERRAVDRSERLMESPYAPVESAMTPCPVTTGATAPLTEILGHFEHFTGLPVVDGEGHCVGIVSDMDVARCQKGALARSAAEVTVGDVMSAPAIVIVQHAPVAYAAGLMLKHKVHRLPVVDDHGVVVGISPHIALIDPHHSMDEANGSGDGAAPIESLASRPFHFALFSHAPLPYPPFPVRVFPVRVFPVRVFPVRVFPVRVFPVRVFPVRVLPVRRSARCPKCLELKLPRTNASFCSQECFKASWADHKALHKAPPAGEGAGAGAVVAGGAGEGDEVAPFLQQGWLYVLRKGQTRAAKMPPFDWTGPLRPFPVAPRRPVPAHIPRPDWADTGRPEEEPNSQWQNSVEIKSPEQIARMRHTCKVAREVLDVAAAMIRPGVTTDEIDRAVHDATIKAGGYPSPLNYYFFPKSCCTYVLALSDAS
ncbi:unnamed protein product [Closterium sp. Naga37s-1]|nr:unnamed protein product [Closterium sp. Naga37s-1]